jgi:hypothetical protein
MDRSYLRNGAESTEKLILVWNPQGGESKSKLGKDRFGGSRKMQQNME